MRRADRLLCHVERAHYPPGTRSEARGWPNSGPGTRGNVSCGSVTVWSGSRPGSAPRFTSAAATARWASSTRSGYAAEAALEPRAHRQQPGGTAVHAAPLRTSGSSSSGRRPAPVTSRRHGMVSPGEGVVLHQVIGPNVNHDHHKRRGSTDPRRVPDAGCPRGDRCALRGSSLRRTNGAGTK